MTASRRFLACLVVASVSVIAFGMVKQTTVTVPEWRIRVVDSTGAIPRGACVSESWLNDSFEPGLPHEEETPLGAAGEVTFAERRATATRARRTLVPILRSFYLHAGSGGNAFVVVWGEGVRGSVLWHEGEVLPATLTVSHESEPSKAVRSTRPCGA